ncbi:hypothetical protein HPK19_03380 [Arthrobacter citreus]|nr:hypothetical protein HPK19_03380 [Arthrobacter citreus]
MFKFLKGKNYEQSGTGNQQAQVITNHNNHGLSINQTKEMMLDMFNDNFVKLSNKAGEIALQRAEELTNNFLERIQNENSDLVNSFEDPDMLYILLQSQMQFARSGNPELEELLVNLLIDRTKEKDQSLKQMTLNEAVLTLPKLNDSHIYYLTMCFVLTEVFSSIKLNNLEEIRNLIGKVIPPFIGKGDYFEIVDIDQKHLDYIGCIRIKENGEKFPFQKFYSKFFTFIPKSELDDLKPEIKSLLLDFYLEEVEHKDETYYTTKQMNYLDAPREIFLLPNFKIHKHFELISEIELFIEKFIITEKDEDYREILTNIHPSLDDYYRYWLQEDIKFIKLTNVGLTIAHSNFNQLFNEYKPLDYYIFL